MHTVCFSKLLSGFTGFLMAGKKTRTPVTGQKKITKKSHFRPFKFSQILKEKGFKIQITIHMFMLSKFYNFFKSSQHINNNWWLDETYIPK